MCVCVREKLVNEEANVWLVFASRGREKVQGVGQTIARAKKKSPVGSR